MYNDTQNYIISLLVDDMSHHSINRNYEMREITKKSIFILLELYNKDEHEELM